MPKSTTFLPDVNVWLALASSRHAHAAICASWLNSIKSDEIVFCRVTQMGLLRLLTNGAVMGNEAVPSRKAWRIYESITADDRIQFANEPFALEPQWRSLTELDRRAHRIWTDAYLAAFARAGSMRLVTLDRAILGLDRHALVLQ